MNQRKFEMAKHAYTTVPYYRELAEKNPEIPEWIKKGINWEKIPLVEKNAIVQKQEKLISEEYLGDLVMKRLTRSHTSGSTGTYLDVYWTKQDTAASLLPLWMERYRCAGIRTKDKVCLFNTVLENEYDIKNNQMILSKKQLTKDKMIRLYEKMQDFEPAWLLLHPGIAEMLIQLVTKEKLSPLKSLKYIELTGEMVLEGLTQKLENIFNCPVRCHYGTMEVNTIGYEKDGAYQVFDKSTYVEIMDDRGQPVKDGEYGNIYVTSLHNRAMPFVRYGIGDIGRILSRNDGIVRLELKHARKNALLCMPDGSKVLPDVLLGPVERINGAMEQMIYQFQVIQQSRNSLLINTVLDSDMEEGEFEKLYLELFQEEWKDEFEWKFQYSNEIQINPCTGKSGWFFNQYKENK